MDTTWLPATYPVRVFRWSESATPDGYGGYEPGYDSGTDVMVYGIKYGTGTDEPLEAGQNRLVVDRVLLIPPDLAISERDHVELPDEPGRRYEVIGLPQRADRNPFRWNPGGSANLRRVDG